MTMKARTVLLALCLSSVSAGACGWAQSGDGDVPSLFDDAASADGADEFEGAVSVDDAGPAESQPSCTSCDGGASEASRDDAGALEDGSALDGGGDTVDSSSVDSSDHDVTVDAPADVTVDAPADVTVDAPVDAGMDAPVDADMDGPVDAGIDASDANALCAEAGSGWINCAGTCVNATSDPMNCGACDVSCNEAGTVCSDNSCITPAIGCSDGTREAFVSTTQFPGIAGCAGTWDESSMQTPSTGVACGNTLNLTCTVPADLCATGWHICGDPPYGPTDISYRISETQCFAESGEFVAALGDQVCDPCSPSGYGAACCGSGCVQQNGSCIWPGMTAWFGILDGHPDLCGDIQNDYSQLGALCCHD
jgi:hypothetical protein